MCYKCFDKRSNYTNYLGNSSSCPYTEGSLRPKDPTLGLTNENLVGYGPVIIGKPDISPNKGIEQYLANEFYKTRKILMESIGEKESLIKNILEVLKGKTYAEAKAILEAALIHLENYSIISYK